MVLFYFLYSRNVLYKLNLVNLLKKHYWLPFTNNIHFNTTFNSCGHKFENFYKIKWHLSFEFISVIIFNRLINSDFSRSNRSNTFWKIRRKPCNKFIKRIRISNRKLRSLNWSDKDIILRFSQWDAFFVLKLFFIIAIK